MAINTEMSGITYLYQCIKYAGVVFNGIDMLPDIEYSNKGIIEITYANAVLIDEKNKRQQNCCLLYASGSIYTTEGL